MWTILAGAIGPVFDFLSKVAGPVAAFFVGRKTARDEAKIDQQTATLELQEKAHEAENAVAAADATELSVMRDKWTR